MYVEKDKAGEKEKYREEREGRWREGSWRGGGRQGTMFKCRLISPRNLFI